MLWAFRGFYCFQRGRTNYPAEPTRIIGHCRDRRRATLHWPRDVIFRPFCVASPHALTVKSNPGYKQFHTGRSDPAVHA